MIISNFSIVNNIDLSFGNINISENKITIHYSGNNIYQIKNSKENINGKVLLNWMDGTNRLYLVLNENKIYPLDAFENDDVVWIINHTELVKKVSDIVVLRDFIKL